MMTVLLKRLFLVSQVAAFSVLAKDQSSLRKGGNIINQDKLDAVGEYDAFVSRQLSMSHSMPICILAGETCFPASSVGPVNENCSTCCSKKFTCPPNVIGGSCTCDTDCLPAKTPCFGGSVPPGQDSCSKCCSGGFSCIGIPGGACACTSPPNCLPVDAKCSTTWFSNTSCLNCCSGAVCQTTPDSEGGSPFCCELLG